MRKLVLTATAAVLSAAVSTVSAAETIKIQASSKAGDWAMQFYEEWVEKFNVMSGPDGVKMEVLPTGAVVPYRDAIDAVANGIIGGDLNAVSYYSGRDQAFSILGDLIAGYDTVDQMQTYCQYGGGREMLQKVYDKYTSGNVVVIGCGPYAREAFVSSLPIKTIDDLKGVKVRSPEGMASDVFRRAGAAPVSLPFSEVYTSLEKGLVEAADASSYVNNSTSGMHKVAKYPIYPGIHSMAVIELAMNKRIWEGLSDADREMIDVWYIAMSASMMRKSDLEDRQLVAADAAAGELTIIDWAQEDRDKLRALAVEAWDAAASKSPLAKEALESHMLFMKDIGLLDE
ncbi:MAG: TRAP transporter substrate-binding protein [Granulosicoccus sp.]